MNDLVAALEAIRPGISADERLLKSWIDSLRPPARRGQKPDADDLERLRVALDAMNPGSWALIALRAVDTGYRLPISKYTMISLVDDAIYTLFADPMTQQTPQRLHLRRGGSTRIHVRRPRPATREGRAADGHHVAFACALLYFLATGERPKVLNYASAAIGACDNYARLSKAAISYFCPSVSWGWLAEKAATDFKKSVNKNKST